jgi:hypothetical protein
MPARYAALMSVADAGVQAQIAGMCQYALQQKEEQSRKKAEEALKAAQQQQPAGGGR